MKNVQIQVENTESEIRDFDPLTFASVVEIDNKTDHGLTGTSFLHVNDLVRFSFRLHGSDICKGHRKMRKP